MAVVFCQAGKNIPVTDAMNYVAGFCTSNDVSERVFQLERGSQWTKGKSADTLKPLGPWLVTKDEVGDPNQLDISCQVNGKTMQSSNTSDMMYSIAELVSILSNYVSWQPGDVLMTGTPPGVGYGMSPQQYLKPGDVVEVVIENSVVSVAWSRVHKTIIQRLFPSYECLTDCLVTGAAQNIGAAIAERFLKAGDTVICADLNAPKNSNVAFIKTNVADEASVSALMAQVEQQHGHLDVLVNNAGICVETPIHELAEQDWDRVMAVNVKSTFLTTKHARQLMTNPAATAPAIVNISSIEGLGANPLHSVYAASKAAVAAFTHNTALEYGPWAFVAIVLHPVGLIRPLTNSCWQPIQIVRRLMRPSKPFIRWAA